MGFYCDTVIVTCHCCNYGLGCCSVHLRAAVNGFRSTLTYELMSVFTPVIARTSVHSTAAQRSLRSRQISSHTF